MPVLRQLKTIQALDKNRIDITYNIIIKFVHCYARLTSNSIKVTQRSFAFDGNSDIRPHPHPVTGNDTGESEGGKLVLTFIVRGIFLLINQAKERANNYSGGNSILSTVYY